MFEDVTGLRLSEEQWMQAGLSVKNGGIGVGAAGDIADAAYIAPRAQTYEDCKELDRRHTWDDGAIRWR